MQPRIWIVCGAILGGAGVLAGAYAAHGLDRHLAQYQLPSQEFQQRIADYEVAVRYQMYHACALVLVGLVGFYRRSNWLTLAGVSFLGGIAMFSGCLYARVFGLPVSGVVVMLGGLFYILGWLALAAAGWTAKNPSG